MPRRSLHLYPRRRRLTGRLPTRHRNSSVPWPMIRCLIRPTAFRNRNVRAPTPWQQTFRSQRQLLTCGRRSRMGRILRRLLRSRPGQTRHRTVARASRPGIPLTTCHHQNHRLVQTGLTRAPRNGLPMSTSPGMLPATTTTAVSAREPSTAPGTAILPRRLRCLIPTPPVSRSHGWRNGPDRHRRRPPCLM